MERNYLPKNWHHEINKEVFSSVDSVTSAAASKFKFCSQTEQNVALIWQTVLGKKSIPSDQDFFTLGGNRALAIQLLKEIHEHFGLDLPLSALIHSPTVTDFTKLVQGETEQSSIPGMRNLHMIKRGDNSVAPLFLIHGHTGDVLIFHELISQLHPKLPVYAFQWAGWDGGKGDYSVKSMAAAYKSELLRFKQQGSYKIGGYGVGGVIALELATQLTNAGSSIDGPLYLFDTPNIKSRQYHPSAPETSRKTRQCEQHMMGSLKKQSLNRERSPSILSKTKVDPFPEKGKSPLLHLMHESALSTISQIKGLLKEIPFRIKRLENHLGLFTGGVVPFERRTSYASASLLNAVKHHEISNYQGSVRYFKSDNFKVENIGVSGWWQDMYLGVPELIAGDFEAHVVGASDHAEVTRHLEAAKIINKQLALR